MPKKKAEEIFSDFPLTEPVSQSEPKIKESAQIKAPEVVFEAYFASRVLTGKFLVHHKEAIKTFLKTNGYPLTASFEDFDKILEKY